MLNKTNQSSVINFIKNIISKDKSKTNTPDQYIMSKKDKDILRKDRNTDEAPKLSDRTISENHSVSRKTTLGTNTEKTMTLDQIYEEKGPDGFTEHLVNNLKQLKEEILPSENINNQDETPEDHSIKKLLNYKLDKKMNDEINTLIKLTQLKEHKTETGSTSSLERHKLFKPLTNLRDDLQQKYKLNVFSDQISHQAQKKLLQMSQQNKTDLVDSTLGIDEESLLSATNNNYQRNYSNFPDSLPTNSSELAHTIIDFGLHEIRDHITGKKPNTNKTKRKTKHKNKIKAKNKTEKEIELLTKKIDKLIESNKINFPALKEKYQKIKGENYKKTYESTKTELKTQEYVRELTFKIVRSSWGEEKSKKDIDDKWNNIEKEFNTKLSTALDEISKSIETYQNKQEHKTDISKQTNTTTTNETKNESIATKKSDYNLPSESIRKAENNEDLKETTQIQNLSQNQKEHVAISPRKIKILPTRNPLPTIDETDEPIPTTKSDYNLPSKSIRKEKNNEDSNEIHQTQKLDQNKKKTVAESTKQISELPTKNKVSPSSTNEYNLSAGKITQEKKNELLKTIRSVLAKSIIDYTTSHNEEPTELFIAPTPSLRIKIKEKPNGQLDIEYFSKTVYSKIFLLENRKTLSDLINELWNQSIV